MGGGLAGMVAASRLLDSGHPVTLVEKRPFLGGRAFSVKDGEFGVEVDNGQHVFLRCYTAYLDFLHKLGTLRLARIQPRLRIVVLGPGGRSAVLSSSPLPAPFHLLPSFLAYSHLSVKERLLALYALVHARFSDRRHPELERKSFHQWLKERRQSDNAIRNFWGLVIRPTLNDATSNVSAAMGLMVFQEALLKGRHNGDIGYATSGLSRSLGDAACEYMMKRGGRLLLGRGISELVIQHRRVLGVRLEGGETLQASWYISALPFDVLRALLPPDVAQEPFFARLEKLSSSPIVDLHVWYDRTVMDEEFVAFVGSPLQWVFNKTRMQGEDGGQGQYLAVPLSSANEYIGKTEEELKKLFLPELARAFPRARQARVTRFLVTREKRATLRCLPGSHRLRPSTKTPVVKLLLAGEWTDTGWPSTMEGAVRSGNMAAEVAIGGGDDS